MANDSVSEAIHPKRAAAVLWSPEPAVQPPGPPEGEYRDRQTMRPERKHRVSTKLKSSGAPVSVAEAPAPVRYCPTIKELPPEERPRERLIKHGPGALSTSELIALLIRTGKQGLNAKQVADQMLAHFGSAKELASASIEQLCKIDGIEQAKAAQIHAAIEFGKRLHPFTPDTRPSIGSPQDVANLLMPELRYQKKETLKSVLLDAKNRVIAVRTVSIGDLTQSIATGREVFKDAVAASAASLIVAHNHPSGDPTPSTDDVTTTKRLIQAGALLGIELLDHIVIGDGHFVSLRERGLI